MDKKILLTAFILTALLCSAGADAATVHGKIYTMELEPALDVIIRINTTPQQTFISKDGFYSFEIPEGKYSIEAVMQSEKMKYASTESIKITDDGEYVFDILLFPDLNEEIELVEEDFDFSDIIEKDTRAEDYLFTVVIVAIIVFIIVAAYAYHRTKKVRKTKSKKVTDLPDKVLEFIKNEDGRTTQKEIRKKFPFSEAKISLVMAELEDKGIIKKIKKGRGNVIVLNKD
ncbi:MAG: hypothetical protein JW716_00095 [Candidatus Aenigmarchaeota archaeon]|nr:hypothetical protein [Candidatus Aenigmarchaeota archaeon]